MTTIFDDNIATTDQIDRTFETEFDESILADAMSATNQLLGKLGVGAESHLRQFDKIALYVFQGRHMGPQAVEAAANYLELFAKKLSP